ncbi:hypothetical protein MMC32_004924 [Xylographa parallela]|nr:hypothetical protein [Xylographa parallela]
MGLSRSNVYKQHHRVYEDKLIGRILTSQTIGVEFASKIIRVGTGSRRQRIKLQLWDTAGTERFRSVSRSYYRGAAGAILVYDITSHASFTALPTFLNDARALASPNLTVLIAGNKLDVSTESPSTGSHLGQSPEPPSSRSSKQGNNTHGRSGSISSSTGYGLGANLAATNAPNGREVSSAEASRWASSVSVPVAVEVSAYNGDGVDELFSRLARMILTKIELGEIDPDDPQSGIQYGDSAAWGMEDGNSVRSGTTTTEEGGLARRRRKRRGTAGTGGWTGMREWEAVFRLDAVGRRRRGGCC